MHEHFFFFKQRLECDGYLSWLRPKIYRDVIIRLRLGINNHCCNKYGRTTNAPLRVCALFSAGAESEIHFIFVCQALQELRNVYIYPHVGVVNDPTFHNGTVMLLPEYCVNLAKFIIESEKVKRAAHENSEFI